MTAPGLRPAQERFLARWMAQPRLGGALDRGLGKTRAAQLGMRLQFEVGKWLVVAPTRVARLVWRQEAEQWGDLDPSRIRLLEPADFDRWEGEPAVKPKGWQPGDLVFRDIRETRKRVRQIVEENDVVLATWDWVAPLAEVFGTNSPFQGVVYDEGSYVRTKSAKRWQAARWFAAQAQGARTVLNGTPIVKNWEGVWAQSYLLDEGETFCRTLGDFRNQFLRPVAWGPGGYVREYGDPTALQLQDLHGRFHRLWIVEQRTDDMGSEYEVTCDLDPEHWKQASRFLRGAIAECEGRRILPANAGVGWSKALQVCNGRVYDEHRDVVELHPHKLEALQEIVDTSERGVMVLCWFIHDMDAVQRWFGKHAVRIEKGLEQWVGGKKKLLITHPRSVGHGLNLQGAGHTAVWFGLQPDLELYLQANARFPREGQTHRVLLPRLTSRHPAEVAVWDTLCGRGTALGNLMKWKDKL